MSKCLPSVWLAVLLSLLYSSASFALSFSECSALRSDRDFAISFNITNAQLNETVGVLKSLTLLDIIPDNIWTNSSTTYAEIYDGTMQIGQNYRIWLEYRASGDLSNSGTLTYYRLVGKVWEIYNQQIVNLYGLLSTSLEIYSVGTTIQNLGCDVTNVAPPMIEQRPALCDLFPEPAQSWITQGTSEYSYFSNSTLDVRSSTIEINGWSDAYKQKNAVQLYYVSNPSVLWDAVWVGFDDVPQDRVQDTYGAPSVDLCDGVSCYPGDGDGRIDERKIPSPPLVSASYTSNQNLTITNGLFDFTRYDRVCSSSSATTGLCYYQNLSSTTVAIYIKKDVQNLTISGLSNGGKTLIVHFTDGINIEHFEFLGKTDLYFDSDTEVNFQTFYSDDAATMTFGSNVWINISGTDSLSFAAGDFLLYGNVNFNYVGESTDGFAYPVIYGPRATYALQGNTFKGYLLAENVTLSQSMVVQGAVTANYLLMADNSKIIALNGEAQCAISNDQTQYSLTIEPAEDYSLICKVQEVVFQVFDDDGNAATDFAGTIHVSPYSNLSVTTGSGSGGVYQPDSTGKLVVNLSSSQADDVTLSTYLSTQTDTSQTVSGTYHFVPYTFDVDDQYVIANKPQSVPISVQACDDSGGVIDVSYTNTPSYSSDWVAPTSGVGQLTMSDLAFSSGTATATLTMEDSGVKTVTLTDSKFNCSSYSSDCPIKGNGTLQGSFTVYSRPWTFAVCPSDGDAMNGNITDATSEGFKAAGASFALHIKPIRWVSNGSVSGAIETTNYCASPVTQNFFSTHTQLAATVNLDHDVAEPSGGASGVLKDGDGDTSVTLLNTDGTSNSYYDFSGLTWSEVGVLQIQANTQSSYLGQTIQTGYRNIGRFYPAYLTITSNSWTYANNLDEFAYMNQPISYSFNVEAQNMSGGATTNYGDFGASLIANIKLVAVNTNAGNENNGARVADYDEHYWGDTTSWSGAALSVTRSFTLLKNETVSSPYTTSPDGPFTSGFGLEVTDSIDNVDFTDKSLARYTNQILDSTNKAFPTQPDFRYGRMVLSDVGGNSESTLSVPLKTQYWNGSQFVVNTEDSGSVFSTAGDGLCKQTIWQNTVQSSSSTLSGASAAVAVTNGQSSVVKVLPDSDTDLREKVRFWIRLDDSSTVSPQTTSSADIDCGSTYLNQPWLQYNWRGVGDEDPSAVVTFGIFRGNDRVIYRGEARMNN
ncbi:DUF6701 domain-containing protein [Vibrio nitrifigilis]|uniref:DUF6701 domain-containing protein n=1 Tax=Vibrio nitrifigilis TaxID=2789781 RepID=A0ABS0GG04_9VIBR|nr:DUF6701 domain-containing protein [Vibrio nitrifigilis]MBF9001361.1 hypothetical protein [Vibrio nitrifigilis]